MNCQLSYEKMATGDFNAQVYVTLPAKTLIPIRLTETTGAGRAETNQRHRQAGVRAN